MCHSATGSAALSPPVCVDRTDSAGPLWASSVCVGLSKARLWSLSLYIVNVFLSLGSVGQLAEGTPSFALSLSTCLSL